MVAYSVIAPVEVTPMDLDAAEASRLARAGILLDQHAIAVARDRPSTAVARLAAHG